MHPLLQQHQHSLLGRLRTKIYTQITGSDERLPTAREEWRFHMNEWKRNDSFARINFHLLHIDEAREISFPAKLPRQQIRAIMRNLSGRESIYRQYVEGKVTGQLNQQSVGCLVLGHTRPSGEPGYYAAILKDEAFPSCGYVSITPSCEAGKSCIAQLGKDGWHEFNATQAGNQIGICIAMTALQNCQIPNPDGTVQMPINQLSINPENSPPDDPECTRRLNLVMRRRMALTKAIVPRTSVRLFSPEFAATLKKDMVFMIAEQMATKPIELLVYWDGNHFVSSDDDHSYLAYELLSVEHLPVVIMGEFPSDVARVERRGGYELMPPAFVVRKKVIAGVTEELRAWQTKEESLNAKRLPPPADLMTSWIVFAEMLAEENINERALHNFLDDNPIMMGAHWDTVQPEVSFGGKYKADFVLRADRALPTVRLVELEKCSHRLFTKDLHETDEVTHAVQQVNDWLRWWRQNPDNPVVAPSRGVNPDGLVVIGRSTRLSEREREALAHNNQGRDIKVITFDELLDDFGTLILHRLDDNQA